MQRRLWISLWSLALVAFGGTLAVRGQSPTAPHALPRYRFTVGQELVYSYRDQNIDENLQRRGGPPQKSRSECTSQWRIWVVKQNDDGSWRLLLDRTVRTVGLDNHVEISRRMLAFCDIFPDGRIVANGTLGTFFLENVNPSWLFVSLPADQEAMAKGWSSPETVGNHAFLCSTDPNAIAADHSLVIRCRQHEPAPEGNGSVKMRRCVFDVATGRLQGFQEEWTGDYGKTRWHCVATTKLESVSQKPTQWLSGLREEAERYFDVQTRYEAQAHEFRGSPSVKECEAHLAAARNMLTAAQKSARLEPLREQYAAFLKLHDGEAKKFLQNARYRQELYSAAPAIWELKDFDGKTHRLRDYRGKVVVLDFWYRGCGWCIKAMPQVNQVAESYKGKGVDVLGMNIDEDDEDALLVLRQEHPKYTNLKARTARSIYHANDLGFPVMYVLDQTGRVRHIQPGFSTDLAKQLGDVIDRLLREPTPQD
jgi:thiol-disulfide isomerase/thioredoxin